LMRAVKTELHIDLKWEWRAQSRVQRMNVTRALALPKEQHNPEHEWTSQEHLRYLRSITKENTNERHKSTCTT
jgi:hypothetical protein